MYRPNGGDPQTLITAAIALARQGDKELQPEMMLALGKINFARLNSVAIWCTITADSIARVVGEELSAALLATRMVEAIPASNIDMIPSEIMTSISE